MTHAELVAVPQVTILFAATIQQAMFKLGEEIHTHFIKRMSDQPFEFNSLSRHAQEDRRLKRATSIDLIEIVYTF